MGVIFTKYFTDDVKYHCPSGLPEAEEQEIQRLVVAAYRALGCRGWGRADIMLRASDRKPFLLEMNTSPGMTSHSLVPMSARAAGISYEDLCGKGAHQIPFAQVPVDKAAAYSCEDSDQTLDVHQVLWPQLQADDASWCAGVAPEPGTYAAKTRYRQSDAACTLSAPSDSARKPSWQCAAACIRTLWTR